MVNQPVTLDKECVPIGSYRLSVVTAGPLDGAPIVFIHGIGASGRYFLPLAKELARDYRVHVLDLPGYGAASKPDRALTVKELAAIVDAYIVDRGLNDAVLIGHSMGCQIAAHAAHLSPPRIQRVVLIGPTVNQNERTRFLQALRLMQDAIFEPPSVGRTLLSDYARMGFWRYLQTSQSMIEDRIEQILPDITLPVLFIRGTKDKIVPREWIGKLLVSVPVGSELHEVAHAPHAVHMTATAEVAVACRQFIEAR